jgi:hypothetical protein
MPSVEIVSSLNGLVGAISDSSEVQEIAFSSVVYLL